MSTELYLHGERYDRARLVDFCAEEKNEPWLRDIKAFIYQWIDEKDYVEVQTSGSTGKPKIIRLKKSAMIRSAELTSERLHLQHGQKALLCIPARYIGGMMMIVRSFVSKLDLHICSPRALLSIDWKSLQFDFSAMVPLQVQNLLSHLDEDISRAGAIIIGGAPISPALENRLKTSSSPVYSTYGMTETSSHIALRRLDQPYHDRAFTPFEPVSLGVDAQNRLSIRVDYISEQWIHTTDIVELKSDQKFVWLGRADHVINSGGVKLHPERIESKIGQVVEGEFFVHGLHDERLGQQVILCLEGENRVDLEVLTSVLDKFEVPKQVIYFDSFIRTANGKIKREETLNTGQRKNRST